MTQIYAAKNHNNYQPSGLLHDVSMSPGPGAALSTFAGTGWSLRALQGHVTGAQLAAFVVDKGQQFFA
jgi:uncharacterized protein YfiM (DUF2279 family)